MAVPGAQAGRPTQNLTDAENSLFNLEWPALISAFASDQPGEYIHQLFERNKEFIRYAVSVGKAVFQQPFNGVDAQSGIGWQLIRPEVVLQSSTNTVSGTTANSFKDWTRTVAVAGFNYWIGTSSVYNQINRRALLVLLGIADWSPAPKSTGLQLFIQGLTYPVYDYYYMVKAGEQVPGVLPVFGFPQPKLINRLDQFKIQSKDSFTGSDELQLLGVLIGESGYLQLQSPTLETP